jgi:putative transcriptional regulator
MAKKILDTVHDTAKGLHKAGVMDTRTMHEFNALCLTPVKNLSAADQTTAHTKQSQSGGVRRVPEHQSVDSAEMGTRPEKAQWSVTEVVESRSAKRLGGARLRPSPDLNWSG